MLRKLLAASPVQLDALNRPTPLAVPPDIASAGFDTVTSHEQSPARVLLTVAEVAARLNISEKSVRRRIKDGTIRKVQLGGRLVRIASDELIRLAAGDPPTAPGHDLDISE